MNRKPAFRLAVASTLAAPVTAWTAAASLGWNITGLGSYYRLALATPDSGPLQWALIGGGLAGIAGAAAILDSARTEFRGAPYDRHLRGPKLVCARHLARATRERRQQLMLGPIPMPRAVEGLHTAVYGSTGRGKSVTIRSFVYSALLRGNRVFVIDPDGDMYSKFGRPDDIVLNPFDGRSPGWTIWNEIRDHYDYKRIAHSVIPIAPTPDAEVWHRYARLLLAELLRKLVQTRDCNPAALFDWAVRAPAEQLHDFMRGTPAEAVFVGDAERALGSTRFVLGTQLEPQLLPPPGHFSLRDWLETGTGSIYVTWSESTREQLKPLVSTWADIVSSAILSLPETDKVTAVLSFDELAQLDKLSSLQPFLTMGRKHGGIGIVGLHATSQLASIFGTEDSQTIHSCFGTLVVLPISASDPRTREQLSLSLGAHEVEREKRTKGADGKTTKSIERSEERIVSPAEIAQLRPLHGFISFAGNYDVGRVKIRPQSFKRINPPFVNRPQF